LVRTLFVSFKLPASVGVILSGFVFSFFIQTDILAARDQLQENAFFLVLLTAGLEITVKDLKPYIFVMAWLPAMCELMAIAAYGSTILGYTWQEGAVLGTVLVALGDGLVIPKMKEFSTKFPGHPMPRLVFTWAPLEACFALTMFGTLEGISAPADQPSINVWMLVFANLLRILATLCAGAVMGAVSGWVIPRRTALKLNGQQLFTGASVEAFLMVLAVALIAFGLGEGTKGKELVPMGFSPGSLFQPELLVIVTGTFFAHVADARVLHEVEQIMGGLWVFGQLVLFSMLGSRTTPQILPQIVHVLPVMILGLLARFAGVLLAIFLTLGARGAKRSTAFHDAVFCFLSTLPRATIQGALGSVPVTQRFFQGYPLKHQAQLFIFTAARLYIVIMSVLGMILLNNLGHQMLKATSDLPRDHTPLPADDTAALDVTDGVADSPGGGKGLTLPSAVQSLAKKVDLLAMKFSVDHVALIDMLRSQTVPMKDQVRELQEEEEAWVGQEPFLRAMSAPDRYSSAGVPVAPMQLQRLALIKRGHPWYDALNQFDAPGVRLDPEFEGEAPACSWDASLCNTSQASICDGSKHGALLEASAPIPVAVTPLRLLVSGTPSPFRAALPPKGTASSCSLGVASSHASPARSRVSAASPDAWPAVARASSLKDGWSSPRRRIPPVTTPDHINAIPVQPPGALHPTKMFSPRAERRGLYLFERTPERKVEAFRSPWRQAQNLGGASSGGDEYTAAPENVPPL
jgi:hypothetical protein